jgi:ribose 5-phosphate isomerase B
LDYKNRLIKHLILHGYSILDCGTTKYVPCDSPFYAAKVGKAVASGECDFGVLICATGSGMTIAANKIKGIMCSVGYCDEVTKLMREHNDANVISFGQNHMGYNDVERRVDIFVSTEFSGLEHQALRVQQIKNLESGKEIELSPILNPNWK